ncbi:MAG: hypothetical protein ISS36_01605 [Candidatus Aenigmarchaeota archaeon]|nr:hypothetical protein [Candidatus Aenigmarchaeota archaeon]
MLKYTYEPNPKKSVKVFGSGLRISTKSSAVICDEITGKQLDKGKRLLQDLVLQKRSLRGKYYTNVSKEILNILQSAENNAEFKGLDPSKLHIHASAHKGFRFWRPRRFKVRRQRRKVTNIQFVLEVK